MIKARPVAGDLAGGEAFLAELQPYVWRKYMDYAAIADVHSIKRQIHAHKGHGEIAVRGHNVKLGRGGIREIEFFVQTQQLIAGGRFPALRGRETAAMLAALAGHGWIDAAARDELIAAYWFLRRSSMPCRWSPTSRRICCRRTTRGWSGWRGSAAFPMRPSSRRPSAPCCRRSSGTMRGCSRRRRSCRPASVIWCSPATSTTPTPCAR